MPDQYVLILARVTEYDGRGNIKVALTDPNGETFYVWMDDSGAKPLTPEETIRLASDLGIAFPID